jgi:hypothetical protein
MPKTEGNLTDLLTTVYGTTSGDKATTGSNPKSSKRQRRTVTSDDEQ